MNNPIRILLVDDSPYFLEAARDFLQFQESLTVVDTATEEQDALAKSLAGDPDVILLDLNLAHRSGLDLIPLFRERLPEVKIIVLTMMEETGYRAAALQASADAFVSKSAMSKTLVSAILETMQRADTSMVNPNDNHIAGQEAHGDARFRSLFEQSNDAVFIIDLQGNHVMANRRAAEMLNYTLEEVQHLSFKDISAEVQKSEQVLKRLLAGEHIPVFERKFRKKNGEMFPVEINVEVVRDSAGKPLHIQSVVRDITERRRTEEALHDREAQLSGLIESAMDAIIVVDEEQHILLFNPAAEQLFKSPSSNAIGSSLTRFIPEAVREKHLDYVRTFGNSDQSRRSMQTSTLELNCLRADGEMFASEISISKFETKGHKRFIAFIRDITGRKRAEIEIQRRNEDLSLLDAVNQALNRGESLSVVVALVSDGLKKSYDNFGATIYLLDSSRQRLVNQNMALPPDLLKKIEKLVGVAIPRVELDLQRDHPFRRVFETRQIEVLNDPRAVRDHYAAFAEAVPLRPVARAAAKKAMPVIQQLVHAKAEMLVPLVSNDAVIGVMDLSGRVPFTENDVKRMESIAGQLTVAIQRKWADETLRAVEEKYRHIFENAVEAITQTTPAGRYITANQAAARMLGFNFSEELIASVTELDRQFYVEPDRREEFKSLMETQGVVTGFESEIRRRDGTTMWISENSQAVRDQNGILVYYEGSAVDITERKRAEESIRQYADIVRHVNIGLYVFRLEDAGDDRTLRILSANPAALRFSGTTWEEIEGLTLDQAFPNLRSQGIPQVYAEVARTGVTVELDDLYYGAGNALETAYAIKAFALPGQCVGVAFEDITERKRAGESLRRNENRYRLATKATNDVIWEWDLRTDQLIWSENAPVVFGYAPEEIDPYETWWDNHIHPDDRQRVLSKLKGLLASDGSIWSEEYRFLLRAGTYAFISDRGYIERDGASKPLRMIGAMSDITERKQAEDNIQRQLKRLNALREIDQAITSTFDMRVSLNVLLSQTLKLLAVDAVTVLLFNAPMNTLEYGAGIGFRTTAVQTANIKLGESYAGKAALERRIVQVPNLADEPDNLFLTGVLKGEGFVSYYGAPLIVKGKVIGVLEVFNRSAVKRAEEWFDFFGTLAGQAAVAVDNAQLFSVSQRELMERRRAEEELRQLNAELEWRIADRTADLNRTNIELERSLRVKDEFLANMSHELRTPLNAILGLSESLAEQTAGELNEKQAKYVGTISESGRHLLELINDILDLAKIEAGQISLNCAKVDINSLCQASLRLIKQLAQKKNQEVILRVDDQFDLIWADERRLKQMIVNLLSNAVKFTPQDGKIGLEVHGNWNENQVMITVWDTGIGIKEEDLSRLFRPFVQLDSELARKTTGTGLGLALVAQMARLHGGSVSVESQPGQGSRFSIVLPWESALTADTSSRMKITGKFRAVKPEDKRQTILLVEDTEEVIMVVRDYLEYSGYNVEIANNGMEGIAQAKQIHPDLILMDVQMPEMNGLEATQRLKSEEEFQNTPIIALTALAMKGDRERCLAAGMDEYISKPVNLKALLKMIQSFLS